MPRERLDRQGAEMQVDVVATSVPVPAAGVFSDTVEQLDVFAHCVLDRRAALADRVGDLDREGEPLPAAVEQLYGLLGLAPIVECHRLPAGLCGVAPRDAVGDVAIPAKALFDAGHEPVVHLMGTDLSPRGDKTCVCAVQKGAPGGIRTHTGSGLSRTPLPVGLPGLVAGMCAR